MEPLAALLVAPFITPVAELFADWSASPPDKLLDAKEVGKGDCIEETEAEAAMSEPPPEPPPLVELLPFEFPFPVVPASVFELLF